MSDLHEAPVNTDMHKFKSRLEALKEDKRRLLEAVEKQREKLEADLAKAQAEKDRLGAENKEIKSYFEAMKAAKKKIETSLKQAQTQLAEARNVDTQQIEAQRDQWKAQAEERAKEINGLESRIKDQESVASELQEQIEKLKDKLKTAGPQPSTSSSPSTSSNPTGSSTSSNPTGSSTSSNPAGSSTSADPSNSFASNNHDFAAGFFNKPGRRKHTLSHANVIGALQFAQTNFSYELPPSLNSTAAGNAQSNNRAGERENNESDNEGRQNRPNKGKERARAADEEDDSSDSDQGYVSDDERTDELNDHRVRSRWAGKSTRKGLYSPKDIKSNINSLSRELLHEALHVKRSYEAFARASVTTQRLDQFTGDPIEYAPQRRNTRLDKAGSTAASMLARPWNQALISVLVKEAKLIVSRCKDRRFGNEEIDWWMKFRERLMSIARDIIESRPKYQGEDVTKILIRMETNHRHKNERNRKNGILHVKHCLRHGIAAIMLAIEEELGDQQAVQFWSYAVTVLSKLDHHGMSDEEDDERPSFINGVRTMEQVRIVQELEWRESSFSHLFALIDQTRQLESQYFSQTGKPSMKRIRNDPNRKVVKRQPPRGLPRSFFKPEYLQGKQRFPGGMDALGVSKSDFQVFDWSRYNPRPRGTDPEVPDI
ncbi:hypothetical protein VKT23_020071 [Stygiomarasmius scandens]|uniref:Uncharacterized protein n=1 Tax=Marasmiellus scandens TaxID=2682957 RepID=A0ABR1IJU2_9AGAR